MDTIELILTVPAPDQDWLVGCLADRATGFVQDEAELRAYVPVHRWAPVAREALGARLRAAGYHDALTVNRLSDRNWNAAWEDALSPVRAGPFLIVPQRAEAPEGSGNDTILHITPEQSFGTGHHATTRLALRLLADAVSPGDRVVDVGTGTGVLAIAACRRGAASALGVDPDPQAVANARENATRNRVSSCVTIRCGSVDVLPTDPVDRVVANITRATLLDLLPALSRRLHETSTLLLSGVLVDDRGQILDALRAHGLRAEASRTEAGWWAVRSTPTP